MSRSTFRTPRSFLCLISPHHEDRFIVWHCVPKLILHAGQTYRRTAHKTAGGWRVFRWDPSIEEPDAWMEMFSWRRFIRR